MGNPFQDQLLKAGLVNKKQVKKAKHEKLLSKKEKKGQTTESVSTIQQELAAQKKRAKELNRKQVEEKQERERLAQVKQLVEQNRLEKDEQGEAYNFVEDNKIKRIYVGPDLVNQISRGQAAIVKLGAGYEVVPLKVARQIASRNKAAVLVLHEGES